MHFMHAYVFLISSRAMRFRRLRENLTSGMPLPTSSFRQFAASRIPTSSQLPISRIVLDNIIEIVSRQYWRSRFARGIQFARSIRKPSKRKFSHCAAKLALKRQRCSEGRNNVVGRSYLSLSVLSLFLPSLNLLFFVFQTYDAARKR